MQAGNRDLNPQAKEMADESMVRNLAAQAQVIWPQEAPLFARYGLRSDAELAILDAGCGTGEISSRLAQMWPAATVLGVDIVDAHLELARQKYHALGARLRFEHRDIFDLGDLGGLGPASGPFDLTVCRHVVQAIPYPERALAELVRVTRVGGWLHVLAEDYGMIHFPRRRLDPIEFWPSAPAQFGAGIGTDLLIGRRAYTLLRQLGLVDIHVDYVVVDTLRAPRETFAAIWEAWRDGFTDTLVTNTSFSREQILAHFNDQIDTLRDPESYAVWHVPVLSGRVVAARSPEAGAGSSR